MSGSAIFTLAESGALPLDLLSLVLPAGFQIVRAPEDIDHDEFEEAARDYLATKGKAHHPDSPGGREIAPCEEATLDAKVIQLAAAA